MQYFASNTKNAAPDLTRKNIIQKYFRKRSTKKNINRIKIRKTEIEISKLIPWKYSYFRISSAYDNL